MIAPLNLEQICTAVDGRLNGENCRISRVCTDSREILAGDLFVALSGENFDGNCFVSVAKEKGAAAVVVGRESGVQPEIIVNDTRRALGQIAALNRRQFHRPLLALTGSSGKTSTKEMLASILSQCGTTFATQGNFNNEIGVPHSLLAINAEHQFAVIEMGAAKKGDIAYLCEFAQPDVAILTNAQPAHIAGFGSLDGVASTKGEIFSALSENGIAVINADDPYCSTWLEMASHCRRLLFSIHKTADVWASDIVQCAEGGSEFVLHCEQGSVAIQLPLPGRHMVANAIAAAAAALAVGAKLNHIVEGLSSLAPVAGRLSRKQLGGVTVIDDSYNANPGSVKAAIDVLAFEPGRKLLVLGAMAELGDDAESMHRDVSAFARESGIDKLFVCGQFAKLMAFEFGHDALAFDSQTQLNEALQQEIQQGDTVLVKGSRSAAMDTVANNIEQFLLAHKGGDS